MRWIAAIVLTACPAAPAAEPAPPAQDPMVEAHAESIVAPDQRTGEVDSSLPGPGGAAALAHLEGCWQASSPDGDRWIVTYSRPIGGVVLGTTRQVRNGRLVLDEFERFMVEDGGGLVVTPIANGIPRDTFGWDEAASGPGNAVFVRRGTGFPQVLEYRRDQDVLDIIARDDDQALGIKLRPGPCL